MFTGSQPWKARHYINTSRRRGSAQSGDTVFSKKTDMTDMRSFTLNKGEKVEIYLCDFYTYYTINGKSGR